MPEFWELAPPGYRLRLDIEKKKRKLLPDWLEANEQDFGQGEPEPDFAAEEQAGLTALGQTQQGPYQFPTGLQNVLSQRAGMERAVRIAQGTKIEPLSREPVMPAVPAQRPPEGYTPFEIDETGIDRTPPGTKALQWYNENVNLPAAMTGASLLEGKGFSEAVAPGQGLTDEERKRWEERRWWESLPYEILFDPANLPPGSVVGRKAMTEGAERASRALVKGGKRVASLSAKDQRGGIKLPGAAGKGAGKTPKDLYIAQKMVEARKEAKIAGLPLDEVFQRKALSAQYDKLQSPSLGRGEPVEDISTIKALSPETRQPIIDKWKQQLDDAEQAASEMAAELELFKEELARNPANDYVEYIQKTLGKFGKPGEKGEVEYLTPKEVLKITGRPPTSGMYDSRGRIPFENALDYKASEIYPDAIAAQRGKPAVDILREEILKAKKARQQISDFEANIREAADEARYIREKMEFIEGKPMIQEPGMPEAGIQSDIFGGQTEVRPQGKGKITQIGMDDQLKLEQLRQEARQVAKPLPGQTAMPGASAPELVPPSTVAQGEAAITPSTAAPQPGAGAIPPVEPPHIGKPPISEAEADEKANRFVEYLFSPKSTEAEELQKEMFAAERAKRAQAYKARLDQLMSEGGDPQKVYEQVLKETMSGELPRPKGFSEVLSQETTEALFAKVRYYFTKNPDEYEQISTVEALRKALEGKPITDVRGIKEGSQRTRLEKVFGRESSVMKMLNKAKKLQQQFEEASLGKAKFGEVTKVPEYPSVPYGKPKIWEKPGEWDKWVKTEEGQRYVEALKQDLIKAEEEAADISRRYVPSGEVPPTKYTAQQMLPLEGLDAVKEPLATPSPMDLFNAKQTGNISVADLFGKEEAARWKEEMRQFASTLGNSEYWLKQWENKVPLDVAAEQLSFFAKDSTTARYILKETGLNIRDLGNLQRGLKATADNSWPRQQFLLLGKSAKADWIAFNQSNKVFLTKNIKEAHALAKQYYDEILHSPLYALYDKLDLDFLRPLELKKGMPAYKGVEEFGFTQTNRPIPRFQNRIPLMLRAQDTFVTGTNANNWEIFKGYYRDLLKVNEEIAMGKRTLKPGESFDIMKALKAKGTMLEHMSGRAQLGPLKSMNSILNNGFFSIRRNLGMGLVAKDLFNPNPLVQKEAWNLFGRMVGGLTAVAVAGAKGGLWDYETDPRSNNVGKIKIGNTYYDPYSGYSKLVSFTTRMLSGQGKSAAGNIYPVSRGEEVGRLFRGKGAPIVGDITDVLTGSTYLGEKLDAKSAKQWAERIAPMTGTNAWDAFMLENPYQAAITTALAFYGQGVATYKTQEEKLQDIAKQKPEFAGEVAKLKPGEPLPPGIKSAVELSPEGQALTKSAGRLTPEKEADFADYNTQLKRDAEWTNNQMTSKDWRAANKIAAARRAAQRELKELRNEIFKKKNPNDLDKAMERYYKLIDDNYDKVAERFKPDMDWELDYFMNSLSGKLRQDVIDNLHPRATPLQKQYYADMETLKPYFDVVDKSPLLQDKDIVQAIKIIEGLKNQITKSQVKGDQREVIVATREALRLEAQFRIKMHHERLAIEKRRIRYQNPEIDRILVKWGYVSKPLRPLPAAPTRELAGVK